jgi:predicted PurR-regulated permease PerM
MADLNAAPQFALCVALGISYILKPLLDFLDDGANKPRSPVLELAVAVLIATLPLAYLMGILLLQLQVAPGAPAPAAVPPAPGEARRLACFACTVVSAVLAVLTVALIAFWFLTGGSPP